LFRLQGTTLAFSLAYHPQSDVQTEALSHLWLPATDSLSYVSGTSVNLAVDAQLRDRTPVVSLLKEHLHTAQNRMKMQADKHQSEREFQPNDWVYLRL
jgi:hypothetical protein